MTFREFLKEKADSTAGYAAALRRVERNGNSWGAAYECGYLAALQFVLLQLPKAAGDVSNGDTKQ